MTLLLKETLNARILAIADSFQPAMRAAFLAAIAAMKQEVPVDQLTALLEEAEQTPLKLAEALDEEAFSVFDELQAKLKEDLKTELTAVVERAALPTVAEFGLDFSVVNERAIRFATDEAQQVAFEVGVETRRAISDIVAMGLREGVAPRQQALLIREIVGLTRRDALAVDRFLKGAIDSGLNRTRAQAQAKRMAARLLKRRAENIARTETIRAANMGTQLGWDAAQDAGLLPRGTLKVWIATSDSRTCPICAVLDGNTVDSRGSFDVSREATSFTIDGDEIRVTATRPMKRPSTTRTPPSHPSCRCTIGLEAFDREANLNQTNNMRLDEKNANPRPGIDDDPTVRRLANEKYEAALRKEPEISEMLAPITADTKAEYAAFSERVKFEGSLREKIVREMRDDPTLSFRQAVNKIRDENRYTVMWDPDGNYRSSMLAYEKGVNKAGWRTIKQDNFWANDGGAYDGMNYMFQKGDDVFELQFHTPGSQRIKDQVHPWYDEAKLLPDGPEKDGLYAEIKKDVVKLWTLDRSHVPPGMQGIGDAKRKG